ncbi:MAG: MarR family transcriptional regulator [Paracoccaceae bacterium]
MSDDERRLIGLATLYEQVVRSTYDKRGPSELQPAQWSALRFFQRAGTGARTVSGLAAYLGVTMGPASRAARALERNGLLVSERNPDDARSVIFTLTPDGAARLREDPLIRLVRALGKLDAPVQDALSQIVKDLSKSLGND